MLVLLVLWLARTSLPRHQPLCINEVTAHHARRPGAVLHHMTHPERLRMARRTHTGGPAQHFRDFRDSLRAQKPPSLLSFPSRISRTRAATDARSALACAQPPSNSHPRSSSGAAPAPWPADRQALRHHRPQLARRATQEFRKSARACARINNWYSLRLASLV